MNTQLARDNRRNAFTEDSDGVTHINISITGKTKLGKMLSHFYESPFKHPKFGTFNSMEGFWHYIQNVESPDVLRSLSGSAARNLGKTLTWNHVECFREIIIAANFYKIEQNEELKELIIDSSLPFDYYYMNQPDGVDATGRAILVRPDSYAWLVEGFEQIRIMFQYDQRPKPIDYDALIPLKK